MRNVNFFKFQAIIPIYIYIYIYLSYKILNLKYYIFQSNACDALKKKKKNHMVQFLIFEL